jgi:hypothetical protein
MARKYNAGAYLAIKLWGQNLGSYAYYITGEQEAAANMGAPLDAIYRDTENKWVCVSDLRADHPFRNQYVAKRAEEAKLADERR